MQKVKGLSGSALKIIALVTMIIDHIGATLYPNEIWFRIIGRMAFPIFVFLIAEGCRHTRDIRKYMLRLFIFGLISEIPFRLAFGGGQFYHLNNIFFTLFFGVAAIWLFELVSKKIKNESLHPLFFIVAVSVFSFAAYFFSTDYQFLGVIAIAIAYCAKNKYISAALLALWFGSYYVFSTPSKLSAGFALLACLLIVFYNGKRGIKMGKYFFYAAYPAHIIVLCIIRAAFF